MPSSITVSNHDQLAKRLYAWQYEAAEIQRFNPKMSVTDALLLALRGLDTSLYLMVENAAKTSIYTLFDAVSDAWAQ